MAEPKIKYDIEAAVSGDADAEKLAGKLREVGDVLEGDLKTGALDAATALEALGAKQGALDAFALLSRESRDLGQALGQASTQVDRLGAELPQAEANTRALAAAESAATSKLQEGDAVLQRWRDALKSLRAETTGAARSTTEYREAAAGLKEGVKAATAEVKAQRDALRTAQQASAAAQNAEAALRGEYDRAVAAAARLSKEYREKSAALVNARTAMQSAGLSTRDLAGQQQALKTAVVQVRQQVMEMAPAWQRAAEASSQSTRVQAQNQRTLREGMTSISTQLQRIQQLATVAVGGGYFGGLIKDLGATADEFRNLESRIKLATGEGPLFEQSFAGVQRVALNTNSALTETGNLFGRLVKAAQAGGASAADAQARALALTRTINQSIQLSGASAEASKAAITQLIQGLQSGVLRGDEFNSVMEQSPRLAQALADGLGVTVGQLRQMATQGQLTADTVIKSLEGQADAVASEFGKLPPTVGRALQNLSTQWTLYVGASDKGLVSSQNAAKVIDALARNLDTLVDTLTAAGKVWAAIKIAQMADGFGVWAARTVAATQALEANSAATVANTAAHRANATAVTASAAAQAGVTAATMTATAASTASAAAQALNIKRWGELGGALKNITLSQGEVARATARSTAFADASAAATGRVAGQAVAAAGKVGILGTAVKGLTAFLGGPIGLAATLVMLGPEIKRLGVWLGESAAKIMGHGKAIEALAEQERLAAEWAQAHAESQRRIAQRLQEVRDASFDLTAQSKALVAEFDKATSSGKNAADAIAEIGKKFDPTTVDGIRTMSSTLQKLAADGKLSADQVREAWAQALDGQDLLKFETNARAAFAKVGEEAEVLREQLRKAVESGASPEAVEALRNRLADAMSAVHASGERMAEMMDNVVRSAVQRTGLDFDNLKGNIGAASRSALNDLGAIVDGLGDLAAKGVDTGRVLTASIGKAIDTADSQQAIDAVIGRIEALRDQLGTPATNALLEQARERAQRLRDELDKAKPGINSLREAMGRLGVETDATLKKAAKDTKDAYDAIVKSGQASQRELSDAFGKAAEAAIKAADGVAPTWVKLEAAARGYRLEVDAAGQAHLAMGDKALTGAEKVAAAFSRMGVKTQAEMNRAAQQAKDDYNTILFSGQATSEGLEQAFRRYADSAIAANGGVASEFLQAEAAQHGLVIAYDNTGKAVVKSAREMGDAMQDAMQRGNEAIEGQMGYLDRLKKRNAEVQSAIKTDANGYALNAAGNTVVAAEDEASLNQRVAKLFGEGAIGNADAIKAANIKIKLDAADKNGVHPVFAEYFANLRKEYARLAALVTGGGGVAGAKKPAATSSTTSTASAAATSGKADDEPSRRRSGGASVGRSSGAPSVAYVNNITLGDETFTFRTQDRADQDTVSALMKRIASDKRRAL